AGGLARPIAEVADGVTPLPTGAAHRVAQDECLVASGGDADAEAGVGVVVGGNVALGRGRPRPYPCVRGVVGAHSSLLCVQAVSAKCSVGRVQACKPRVQACPQKSTLLPGVRSANGQIPWPSKGLTKGALPV